MHSTSRATGVALPVGWLFFVLGERLHPPTTAISKSASKGFESGVSIKTIREYRPHSSRQGARLAVENNAL